MGRKYTNIINGKKSYNTEVDVNAEIVSGLWEIINRQADT